LLIPLGAWAQDQPPAAEPATKSVSFGGALAAKFPNESFAIQYDTGYGIYGIMDYPLIPLLDLAAGIGWNHFPAGAAGDAIDVWEFVGGARVRLGVFFMSGEVAYYTEIKETSFLPGLGLRFKHFEVAFNVRAVSGGSWQGLRLGYYF
jgi:hypothetical protein